MGLIRPATPGFLVTLIATILLAVVSFNVPILKSIYFLKASVRNDQVDVSVTFGTLGYCLDTGNNQTCSKPTVGYELGEYFSVPSPPSYSSHSQMSTVCWGTAFRSKSPRYS